MAHGLKALELSHSLRVKVLGTSSLVETTLSSLMAPLLMAPLDVDPNHTLCFSLDAEWNISRLMGVSIIQLAPHSDPDSVFIIPVCKAFYYYICSYN